MRGRHMSELKWLSITVHMGTKIFYYPLDDRENVQIKYRSKRRILDDMDPPPQDPYQENEEQKIALPLPIIKRSISQPNKQVVELAKASLEKNTEKIIDEIFIDESSIFSVDFSSDFMDEIETLGVYDFEDFVQGH